MEQLIAKIFAPTTGVKLDHQPPVHEGHSMRQAQTSRVMWWGVMYDSDNDQYWVVESYDDGKTWITNTDVPTYMAGLQFIYYWMEQELTV